MLGLQPWIERARPLFPWVTLAYGVISGILMDRSPERGPWVGFVGIVGWFGLVAVLALAHRDAPTQRHRRWLWHLSRFGGRWLSQSGAQLLLFFSLPYYARAAAPTWGHGAFLTLLVVAAALTLWDPLHQRVTHEPLWGALLHGVAASAGLNVILPVLGFSNGASLTAAVFGTAVALPLVVFIGARKQRGRKLLGASAVALTLCIAQSMGGLGRLIPAAPLRLTGAAIGTELSSSSLALRDPRTLFEAPPGQLVCFTQIWAPRGLRDALFHVWRFEQQAVDRIPLHIDGGRAEGFRTWSIKTNLGDAPQGRWSCEVETESGQVLGGVSVQIR